MEIPVFQDQQPGATYYYSPLSIYNLGMVDQAHNNGDGEFKDHLFCHVYHEGVGLKGANNVCLLIVKTLRLMDIMKQDDMGRDLNIIFDNCSGQNKNNTALKLLVWLTEMKFFKKGNLIFLVVGHTKYLSGGLFNAFKMITVK